MTLLDSLWTLWKEYVDYYVVGNSELKKIMFHVFLGVVLTTKGYGYAESGKKKSVRFHTFMIQDSGTGKSQMMKAYHDLVKDYAGIEINKSSRARMTVKDNEASLTGSVYRDQRTSKIVKRKGMLHYLYTLCWDEGSILLKPSAFMDIMTDVFQVVMDEPGRVSKGMKLGNIEYPTDVTLVAGSYMFDAFRETLITKGFLQRMFLFHKEFTPKEKRDIRIGVNLMKLHTDPEKIEKIKRAIAVQIDRIPTLVDHIIKFNREDVLVFNEELENMYGKFFDRQFGGEKQRVLETFYSRIHILVDKVATIKAIIEGKSEVDIEDLKYARMTCQMHIDSLLALFEFLKAGKVLTVPEERQNVILSLVRQNDGKLMQKELMTRLKEMKDAGNWDLGMNKTLKLIENMERSSRVHVQILKKGAKLLFV